jgi:hypothetical protein
MSCQDRLGTNARKQLKTKAFSLQTQCETFDRDLSFKPPTAPVRLRLLLRSSADGFSVRGQTLNRSAFACFCTIICARSFLYRPSSLTLCAATVCALCIVLPPQGMSEFYVNDVLGQSYSIILGFGGGNAAKLGVIDLSPEPGGAGSVVGDVKVFNGTLS